MLPTRVGRAAAFPEPLAGFATLIPTMVSMQGIASKALLVLVAALAAGCAAAPAGPAIAPGPPVQISVAPAIVTPSEVATEQELAARGERALMEQRWADAIAAYRTLVAADVTPEHASEYLFDLGLALEGAQARAEARDTFLELARRFPSGSKARAALVRASSLDAYMEDWKALSSIGDALLARGDLEDIDRIVALGSRGLARVEMGDDMGASKDVFDGLELSDRLHYGARDVLPVAVAQLRFALGEMRRLRSEHISFEPLPPDFVAKLEERCGGLLEAQEAYAMAVRSIDPHWAAMSGYRVGEMYRKLHKDLMEIPPPATSKTEQQKQMFFAFMHIRYRILLEKGLRELDQTIALGERTSDSSAWIQRARDAKAEMDLALADEKAQIAKMPFTEAEVNAALDLLQKKTAAHPGR
jgi:tetratricopeptide (TPR) repeat protein